MGSPLLDRLGTFLESSVRPRLKAISIILFALSVGLFLASPFLSKKTYIDERALLNEYV